MTHGVKIGQIGETPIFNTETCIQNDQVSKRLKTMRAILYLCIIYRVSVINDTQWRKHKIGLSNPGKLHINMLNMIWPQFQW